MMNAKLNFTKLLVILFSISLLLLLSHLVLSFVYHDTNLKSALTLSNGEINKKFKEYDGYNIEVTAEEKKIHGRTLMQVTSDRAIKLKAEFRISNDIDRTGS